MQDSKVTYKTRGIYCIVNTQNNKVYYGSSVKMAKRWWEHKKHLRLGNHPNPYIQTSWNKYGEDSFVFLIEKEMENSTDKEILIEEQKYIDLYWDNRGNCYNISKIADKPDFEANKIPILQLDKNTNTIIKEWPSQTDACETLKIKSVLGALRGREITAHGFKWRYKDPELATQFIPRKFVGLSNKRKIYNLEPYTKNIIKEFDSLAEAAAFFNINYLYILGVCAGRRQHTMGLQFCYSENYDKLKG